MGNFQGTFEKCKRPLFRAFFNLQDSIPSEATTGRVLKEKVFLEIP